MFLLVTDRTACATGSHPFSHPADIEILFSLHLACVLVWPAPRPLLILEDTLSSDANTQRYCLVETVCLFEKWFALGTSGKTHFHTGFGSVHRHAFRTS